MDILDTEIENAEGLCADIQAKIDALNRSLVLTQRRYDDLCLTRYWLSAPDEKLVIGDKLVVTQAFYDYKTHINGHCGFPVGEIVHVNGVFWDGERPDFHIDTSKGETRARREYIYAMRQAWLDLQPG